MPKTIRNFCQAAPVRHYQKLPQLYATLYTSLSFSLLYLPNYTLLYLKYLFVATNEPCLIISIVFSFILPTVVDSLLTSKPTHAYRHTHTYTYTHTLALQWAFKLLKVDTIAQYKALQTAASFALFMLQKIIARVWSSVKSLFYDLQTAKELSLHCSYPVKGWRVLAGSLALKVTQLTASD